MTVMSALVLAFVLGFSCAVLPDTTSTLKSSSPTSRNVIQLVITKQLCPCCPYTSCVFSLDMTAAGTVAPVLLTFIKIIAVIFALHVGVLVLQYCVAALFSGYNPLKSLWKMMPAYATALGTQSSAATIPVTLERSMATGVSADTAGFVIPLCATIHMSGLHPQDCELRRGADDSAGHAL